MSYYSGFTDEIESVYRNFNTAGDAGSGDYKPPKSSIRNLLNNVTGWPARPLERYGALPGTATSSHTAFISAMEEANDLGFLYLQVTPGAHLMTQGVQLDDLDCDLVIEWLPGASLYGTPDFPFDDPLLRTFLSFNSVGDPYARTITIIRPKLDLSQCPYFKPGSGSEGIAFHNWSNVFVRDPDLFGGDYEGANADSGLLTIECDVVDVDGGRIVGFADSGIYLSGNANTGDLTRSGTSTSVRGVTFGRNFYGITSKRELNYLLVEASRFHSNNFAIATLESQILGGRRVDVDSCFITHTNRRPIDITPGCVEFNLRNTQIIDYGYLEDGVTLGDPNPSPQNPLAVYIQGAQNVSFESNRFGLSDWEPSGAHYAIDVHATLEDLDSITYYSGKHYANGNVFQNLDWGIAEHADEGTLPSVWKNCHFKNVTDPATGLWHDDSLMTYTIEGSNVRHVRKGSTETTE